MKVKIHINKGITIDNIEINLGDNTEDIKKKDIDFEEFEGALYLFDSTLAIFFENNRVEYIELSNNSTTPYSPILENVDVFSEKRQSVKDFLEKLNCAPLRSDDLGDIYADNIGITIDAGITQADIDECIQDAKAEGIYEEMKDSIEQDIYRMEHIEILGISKVTA